MQYRVSLFFSNSVLFKTHRTNMRLLDLIITYALGCIYFKFMFKISMFFLVDVCTVCYIYLLMFASIYTISVIINITMNGWKRGMISNDSKCTYLKKFAIDTLLLSIHVTLCLFFTRWQNRKKTIDNVPNIISFPQFIFKNCLYKTEFLLAKCQQYRLICLFSWHKNR